MEVISDPNYFGRLTSLLNFLERWENRPWYLTQVAYCLCSDISARLSIHPGQDPAILAYLFAVLRIGFRRVDPNQDWTTTRPGRDTISLTHTSHHEWMFDTIFANSDDNIIADAVCVWIVGGCDQPPGSCVHYLAQRVNKGIPFSPRLRQVVIGVLERGWHEELEVAGAEVIRLLNHLGVGTDDMGSRRDCWGRLLVDVIRSPMGREGLSSHYWCLLWKLVSGAQALTLRDEDMGVMGSLEDAEDWEKLEMWMLIVWSVGYYLLDTHTEDVERATLKLFLRRPSALPRFRDLGETSDSSSDLHRDKLRQICDHPQRNRHPQGYPCREYLFASPNTYLL